MSLKLPVLILGVVAGTLSVSPSRSHAQESDIPNSLIRLRFTETVRRETRIHRDPRHTGVPQEVRIIDSGKISIDFEVSLPAAAMQTLAGDTEARIEVGAFSFKSSLARDPNYKPGRTSTILKGIEEPDPAKRRPGTAVLKLRWEHGTVIGKLEAAIPASDSIAAISFLGNNEGELYAQPVAKVQIGQIGSRIRIFSAGSLSRTHSSDGDDVVAVESVRLHGDTRTP